jgi:chromate reductase
MSTSTTILGIAGSLRKASYNRGALRAAQQLAPAGAQIEIFDLDGIPPYNQDDDARPPEKVTQFKNQIRAADAILICTPEYNYSIPGVLKNAIDWASRPYGDSVWDGKPVAIMGAAAGMLGTARAQYHLRQVFVTLNMYPLNKPEVMIANASERFDEQGNLTDQKTREHIKKLVEALVKWTQQLQKARQ